MRAFHLFSATILMFLTSILGGCNNNGTNSGAPNADEVGRAIGAKVTDLQCAPANGKPGYVCTYYRPVSGQSATTRFVKRDGGRWDFVD